MVEIWNKNLLVMNKETPNRRWLHRSQTFVGCISADEGFGEIFLENLDKF